MDSSIVVKNFGEAGVGNEIMVEVLEDLSFLSDPKIMVARNPLVEHFLNRVRDCNADMVGVCSNIGKVTELLFYEVMRSALVEEITVTTPVGNMSSCQIDVSQYCMVTAFRAGLLMTDAIRDRLGLSISIGVVDMHRNEEDLMNPFVMSQAIPDGISNRKVLVCDPMLATGGSGAAVVYLLTQQYGCKPGNITFLSLMSAPQGIKLLRERFPEMSICTAAVDVGLTVEGKYIFPGGGDIGDRGFGTAYDTSILRQYINGSPSAG